MGRLVMDGGMRRIKRAAPVVAEPVDPRLVLVDLFVNGQVAPEGFIDLSVVDAPNYSALFIEDAQETAEQPVADETENYTVKAPEAADEAPAKPRRVVKPSAPVNEDDYDPIAAVLG